MFDRGAHSGRGLSEREIALFKGYQERAGREFATSGIRFDMRFTEGAYLRTQGYTEIAAAFLMSQRTNLFVTDTLRYDIDLDRAGGGSMGPLPFGRGSAGDRFYRAFLGLNEASSTTFEHESAHHFTLDTRRNPTVAHNLWSDLRNDYWLWRQRHGIPIAEFRACANSVSAKLESKIRQEVV